MPIFCHNPALPDSVQKAYVDTRETFYRRWNEFGYEGSGHPRETWDFPYTPLELKAFEDMDLTEAEGWPDDPQIPILAHILDYMSDGGYIEEFDSCTPSGEIFCDGLERHLTQAYGAIPSKYWKRVILLAYGDFSTISLPYWLENEFKHYYKEIGGDLHDIN